MMTESAIRQKLKQAIFRQQKKEIEISQRRFTRNCRYNRIPTFLDGEDAGGPCICVHPERSGVVCDSEQEDLSGECPFFTSLKSVDDTKRRFREILAQGRSEVSKYYPGISSLMLVLNEDSFEDPVDEEATGHCMTDQSEKLSSFLFRLFRWK